MSPKMVLFELCLEQAQNLSKLKECRTFQEGKKINSKGIEVDWKVLKGYNKEDVTTYWRI